MLRARRSRRGPSRRSMAFSGADTYASPPPPPPLRPPRCWPCRCSRGAEQALPAAWLQRVLKTVCTSGYDFCGGLHVGRRTNLGKFFAASKRRNPEKSCCGSRLRRHTLHTIAVFDRVESTQHLIIPTHQVALWLLFSSNPGAWPVLVGLGPSSREEVSHPSPDLTSLKSPGKTLFSPSMPLQCVCGRGGGCASVGRQLLMKLVHLTAVCRVVPPWIHDSLRGARFPMFVRFKGLIPPVVRERDQGQGSGSIPRDLLLFAGVFRPPLWRRATSS